MTAFIDTNILVYAFSLDPKAGTALAILAAGPGLAVQSCNEFALVGRRKLGLTWAEIGVAITETLVLCGDPVPLTLALHHRGRRIAELHDLRLYDAMIVAAALETESDTLWSEDMHHGLVVAERLTIRNPFIA